MVKVILKPLDDGVTGDIELPGGKTTLGRGTFLNVSVFLCAVSALTAADSSARTKKCPVITQCWN